MTQFEYLSVLISILIALGISRSVVSWGRLLRARGRVRFYWLHGFMTVIILILLVQFWWGFWSFRVVEDWTIFKLLIKAAQVIALSLAASVLAPDTPGPDGVDLKAFYFEHGSIYFLLIALYLALAMINKMVIGGLSLLDYENLFRLSGIAVALLAARWKSEKFHAILAALATLALLGFVGVNIP